MNLTKKEKAVLKYLLSGISMGELDHKKLLRCGVKAEDFLTFFNDADKVIEKVTT